MGVSHTTSTPALPHSTPNIRGKSRGHATAVAPSAGAPVLNNVHIIRRVKAPS